MYWKEIPVQVQAKDELGQASQPLDARFQEGADSIAMFDESAGTDNYLDGWEWRDYGDVEGSASDATSTVAERFNSGFPADFVARVRDMHREGKRDPSPGAIDHWLNT